MYLYEMKVKFEEIFVPYKELCKTGEVCIINCLVIVYWYLKFFFALAIDIWSSDQKFLMGSCHFFRLLKFWNLLQMETLVLEGDNPAAALVRYISDSRITYLVLGSWSSNFITRYIPNQEEDLLQCNSN